MTSEDNNGNKLVASVRKSKTGTVASKTSDRPAAAQANSRQRTTSRPAARTTTNERGNSLFSHGCRVWPD